jgi:hypothetical protein
MCSAPAKRDVRFACDVSFGSDVRLTRVKSGTHHITATKGSDITFAACGKHITCPTGQSSLYNN